MASQALDSFYLGDGELIISDEAIRDAVKEAIRTSDPEALVGRLVVDRIPHVFADDPVAYRDWRETLSRPLGVDPCNLFVVGSSFVGCSINPYKDWKLFDDQSDVDVAVISSRHFDLAWRMMRLTKRADVSGREWKAIEEHRTRLIYWGCVATDQILGRLPFAQDWLSAASQASATPPTEGREVNFRVYRDATSLRDYTINGLRQLKAELLT